MDHGRIGNQSDGHVPVVGSQWFDVQEETSNKWCPPRVRTATRASLYLHQNTSSELRKPPASLWMVLS